MLRILLIFLVAVVGVACEAQTGITNLKSPEFVKASKNQWIVDVRTPQEFNSGHLEGAENVDVNGSEFKTYFEKGDRQKPVFLYCRSGSRSAYAARMLKSMGYSTIYNMEGGMLSYRP